MPLPDQEESLAVLHARLKTVEADVVGMESRVAAISTHIHEMDMKGTEHGEMLLRISQLEHKMDDLPSRVNNLEKYGSDVTIRLPDIIDKLALRVERLEKRPKKKKRKERERWARQQQRINVSIAVASVLAVLLSIYVNYLLR